MIAAEDRLGPARIVFTDRHGGETAGSRGPLNLGRTDEDPAAARNFDLLRQSLGLDRVLTVHQVHGVEVHRVSPQQLRDWPEHGHLGDSVPGQAALPVADAIVGHDLPPRTALAIRVADCLPVVLADPAAGVLAVAHAGRPGVLGDVLGRTLDEMAGLGATEVVAWIGPHVCADCYEVPAAMATEAAADWPMVTATTSWGTPSLDLAAVARHQLERHRITRTVHRIERCTRTDPDLHSHRRDGAGAGRSAGLVWFDTPGE